MQAAVLNHLVALVADAVLNDHHRHNPIVHDHDLDPDRHVVVVAQRLRVCSAAYMALGASLLIIVGDGDSDGDHNDHVLEGFLLWMAGAVLLQLSFAAARFPAAALVAAGVAQAALKELAVPTILALARHWNTIDLGFQSLNL
jgi:hypothetical protein